MNSVRLANESERKVIAELLQGRGDSDRYMRTLDTLQVKPMSDGGMGSLLLLPLGSCRASRSFGKVIARGEFTDTDNVPVFLSLHTDTEGYLFELDVWKADFSPLKSWPDAQVIRVSPEPS